MVSETLKGRRLTWLTAVLILVLVEDGLGVIQKHMEILNSTVLILVLVEDGLGDFSKSIKDVTEKCLNPCFSGGWSRSAAAAKGGDQLDACLNPCFSGGWSRRGAQNARLERY